MDAIEPSVLITLLVLSISLSLLTVIAQWRVYSKAGQPGWTVLVPIYNLYILLKIVGKPAWWLLMFLIPGVNFVFIIWTYNLLSKSFGHDEGYTVGLIFLPLVFHPVLGFGKSEYVGPAGMQSFSSTRID